MARTVHAGETVAAMGLSGSGNTYGLAEIRAPTAGQVHVAGRDPFKLRNGERPRHRLPNIGIIFQFGELLPEPTVPEKRPCRFR